MYGIYQRAEVNFEYQEEIGQDGKNSRAFIAHDKHLDANLVIKQIPKVNFDNAELFFEESRTLYKAAHPHVVQIQYACACQENIYLALPYYQNGSLKDLIKSRQLSMREIIRFSIQICTGLHNIHSKGLIHFDIKPDNILLSDRNEALVSDFGLAKNVDQDYKATPELMYKKHIAPEYFTDKSFSYQYDIYQLGLTMYRMINGEANFHSQLDKFKTTEEYRDAILAEEFPSRLTLEHIPARLASVITKCLKANLSDRYYSALEVANELSQIDDNTLDWIYTEEDGIRTWTKSTESHEYRLTIAEDGSSVAQKKTTVGKWANIRDFCSTNLNRAAIKRFLRQF